MNCHRKYVLNLLGRIHIQMRNIIGTIRNIDIGNHSLNIIIVRIVSIMNSTSLH